MAILDTAAAHDVMRRIRAGELVDETLSTALIDLGDTINQLALQAEEALAAADIANAAARAAKEANAELYTQVVTQNKAEEETQETEEIQEITYEELFTD